MAEAPRTRLVALAAVVAAGAAAVAIVAPVLGQDGERAATIGPLQATLIAIGYYLSNSPWILGNGGFLGLYRPLVAGFLVGLILGDPAGGAAIGAAINVLYLGFISAGGSIPADPSVAGWVGTALALAGGLDAQSAISIGVAVGLLGTFIFFTRMSVDAVFAHWADERAERADIGGVALMNVLPPQIFLFVISFLPVFLATYLGAPVVGDAIAWLQTNAPFALRGLQIAGGLLPAIGIAMNMRFIFRGSVVPYFFIGFVVAVAARDAVNIVAMGVIGLALAFLHVAFVRDRVGPAGGQRVVDERVEATQRVSATSEGV
ncbi:MAG: PTS mannose/fructose/sorbose/N-acetylgalactosamine transporter subunit IIC [Candidatus Limnocylindria bacterium]